MKDSKIKGFPEWLPEQRLVELYILDRIRDQFELFGFTSIETRSVELLDHLLTKGETNKEIYVLRRLQADADASDSNMGLHFDLTIPLARYVMQNRGQLQFPLKRYQIQKVWRGERPQEGRYREFYQADIDVIADGHLPLHFDAEMPQLLHAVLKALPIPAVQLRINNRKLMEGFYRGLGIQEVGDVLRAIDKVDKIGEAQVLTTLIDDLHLSKEAALKCLQLGNIRESDASFVDQVHALGVRHDLLEEGLQELAFVMEGLGELPPGSALADLHIARGLDYYTGTVYEGYIAGYPSLGAVCSGGRYDNLASSFGGSAKLPGIGVSIGVTRLMGFLLGNELIEVSRKTPTCVLVALPADKAVRQVDQIARCLRSRGICCETYHQAVKYGKQIHYAASKGIPYVWFPGDGKEGHDEVRNLTTGHQIEADRNSWTPALSDLTPQISLKGH